MVVGFTTNCAVSAYHHWSCEFESHWGGVYSIQHYLINFCQWLLVGQWFSAGTPISSINKTDHHDITEILLKVALKTVNQSIHQPYGNLFTEYLIIVQHKYINTLWNMHAQRCQFSGLSTNIICKLVNSGLDHNVILKELWRELVVLLHT